MRVCSRCGSETSQGFLLAAGDTLVAVDTCPKCGRARPRCPRCDHLMEYFDDTIFSIREVHCPICGYLESESYRAIMMRSVDYTPISPKRKNPCHRQGCKELISDANATGLCHVCQKAVQHWRGTKQEIPAPFLKVAGDAWIINPARTAWDSKAA